MVLARQHILGPALTLVLLGSGATAPAGAVEVIGSVPLGLIDFGTAPGVTVPPPLLIGTPGPTSVQFAYDTNAAASTILSPDGLVGHYIFTQTASLTLTLRGETYSTTASPANPLEIVVAGNNHANDNFEIAPRSVFDMTAPPSSASDPSNPIAAFPILSFQLGTNALPNGQLPTADFSTTAFSDPDVFLTSIAQRGSPDFFTMRFLPTTDVVSVNTVPEPVRVGLIWLLLGAFGLTLPAIRERLRGRASAPAA